VEQEARTPGKGSGQGAPEPEVVEVDVDEEDEEVEVAEEAEVVPVDPLLLVSSVTVLPQEARRRVEATAAGKAEGCIGAYRTMRSFGVTRADVDGWILQTNAAFRLIDRAERRPPAGRYTNVGGAPCRTISKGRCG
jgi:hypothetical protein